MCTFSYIQRGACSYVMDICVLDSINLLCILQLRIILIVFQIWLYIHFGTGTCSKLGTYFRKYLRGGSYLMLWNLVWYDMGITDCTKR